MKGIKRHPCLRPLSRDHLIALMAALKLTKAGKGEIELAEGVSFFLDCWNKEISIHLQDEERILPEFISDGAYKARLLADHVELRKFVEHHQEGASSKDTALAAGEFLEKHVRWEEHELFPHIENSCSPEQIRRLCELTEGVEQSRDRKSWS